MGYERGGRERKRVEYGEGGGIVHWDKLDFLKNDFQMDFQRFVVKFVPLNLPFNQDMIKYFPQMKQVFIARHPKQCFNSWFKLSHGEKIGIIWK